MTDHPPIVAEALTVHGTLYPDEYAALIEHWSKLDHRLRSFDRHSIGLDLHVHDRDTSSQRVILEATIPGFAPFVAKDDSRDLGASLNHVRDEMIRQLGDAKNKTEPRNNRRLRRTARRSSPDA
ncbi:hypothetical protein BDK89_2642 [Ilumatobacter fluminis]|uniref:Sigma 54 modulation/S30EA-like ribosomal protein n=1 Tax=Ilumatobacter fluminis TaxID=467091 RepID=A0A4R7I0S0_9ACTN|nr:hypothetical protein [Ilumatobacter fluminis]TDT17041.1 hypothetical protein BDK89_2642 [Ilumatobacter fluminis]